METIDLLRSGQLAGSKRLSLATGLTQFPTEIFNLANSLEILDLSHNHLSSLPANFGRLKKLKIVFLSNNDFTEVPAVLADCPDLDIVGFKSNKIKVLGENALPSLIRWLILTDNKLKKLPRSIGQLSQLQKLMLAGNQITTLPDKMSDCQNLELVRLSANLLECLPPWLFTLPRLSWLAYAGNPCCQVKATATPLLSHISWQDLEITDVLGEGASGIISQGTWQLPHQPPTTVAIKIFKGAITSDGSPLDEMNACLAAGGHPNLVGAVGKIIDHPADQSGLVLSFIPPHYQNLGKPPNLDTCTRDTYAADTSFSVVVVLQIAIGIAAAAAYLHAQGIMHGDLYAHNILVNAVGHSLLGDFGAASSYDQNDINQALALERLEVRAFGCLLEDLLDRCASTDTGVQHLVIDRLKSLQKDCLHTLPAQRPLFTDICKILAEVEVMN